MMDKRLELNFPSLAALRQLTPLKQMDSRINQIAALANVSAYNEEATRRYIDGAPHIKHVSLRLLYGKLAVEVFDEAKRHATPPRVLDLGAGEGSVTLPFLELGARVVAVDISSSQLSVLKNRCAHFGDMLETRCEDFHAVLSQSESGYDIIVANSFLHHVPDYLSMIQAAIRLLRPGGQFFSFQDPLRYDSLGMFASNFSKFAYVFWRMGRGDVVGGLRRRFRRARGVYLENSMHDNTEYHVTRNGVDQEAIRNCFEAAGYDCRIVTYFSTQNRVFFGIGTLLGVKNTFSVIARKR